MDLNGKVKFPECTVVHCGDQWSATALIRKLGATSVVGSTLTGGDWSTLTGGNGSTLTGGDWSTLTGGNGSTLTGGNDSTLTGGDGSTLTGGDGSVMIFHLSTTSPVVAIVGVDGILPGVAYHIDGSGKVVPVEGQPSAAGDDNLVRQSTIFSEKNIENR